MLRVLTENTVDMGVNYDGVVKETTVLPAAFQYLVVKGSTGHRGRVWPPT
jgi:Type IIA topoisomerase (DNA gyrase/topo II, topoisomerase IV), A subunit